MFFNHELLVKVVRAAIKDKYISKSSFYDDFGITIFMVRTFYQMQLLQNKLYIIIKHENIVQV